jgi:hypothetical protein
MANERPKLSVGGEQQMKDNRPKIAENPPAKTVTQALANAKKQVDATK